MSSVNPFVFVVGSARSGTTLLQRLLDAHPQLAVINETHWVPRFYRSRDALTGDGFVTPALIERLVGYYRFPQFGIVQAELEKLIATDERVHYSTFVSGFYDLVGSRHGKRLVGDKTGSYARRIPMLHRLWPGARFVHLIRDGRDVTLSVLSWKESPGASRFVTWAEDRVSTTALWWERNVRLGREAGAALPPGLYHEIRYEALVTRPTEECEALCAFLGVPFEPAMLRFHEGRTRLEPGLSTKDAWLPITPGLRDWRSQMPAEDVERFEAASGDLLDELGYERAYADPSAARRQRASELRKAFVKTAHSRRRPVPVRW